MKVFQLHPQANVFCHPESLRQLDESNFSGCPFPEDWKRVELLLNDKGKDIFDFYGLGAKALVCSKMASMWCSPLWDEGEFLPVRIKGLRREYFLYNDTHCASHLNPKKTTWATDKRTGLRTIKSPAFHAERLDGDCVFKIPEDGATTIYTLERDDVPEQEGLKTLVERHGLTGLEFKLVWSDKKRKAVKGSKNPES